MATFKVSDEDRRKANLRLLQRLDSSVQDIVSSASHVGLYEFQQSTNAWEKKRVEGSLFLVKRTDAPRFQLQILNRNSTENWALTVLPDMQLQNQDPYLILGIQNQEGERVIQGIWFYNGNERDSIASVLTKAVKSLQLTADPVAAATALLSPLNLGGYTIPISHAPAEVLASSGESQSDSAPVLAEATAQSHDKPESPQKHQQQQEQLQQLHDSPLGEQQKHRQPPTPTQQNSYQQHFVLDKKSLQLSLLSLIQDDRFLDLIHAQYLKVAHARANRNTTNGGL